MTFDQHSPTVSAAPLDAQFDNSARPTIGLLISEIGRVVGQEFLKGLTDAADELDINLLCFVGGKLAVSQPSSLYDLIDPTCLDGVILSGDIGFGIPADYIQSFCARFGSLPIIASNLELSDIPTVSPDNFAGISQVINHLISAHRYNRIAFVGGPSGQLDAEQRYQGYLETLRTNHILFDQNLVYTGDFSTASGRKAISVLIDQRKASFQAIVCANDEMAIGALEALQERGIIVPEEVALTGFGNLVESQILDVPLTTVRQSLYLSGKQCLVAAACLIHGEKPPANELKSPTELLVRWSCGCLPETVRLAAILPGNPFLPDENPEELKKQAISSLVQTVGPSPSELPAWEYTFTRLWDSFNAALDPKNKEHFLKYFNQVLHQLQVAGLSPAGMQDMLSLFRQQVMAGQPEGTDSLPAENLLQQARLLVGEFTRRAQAYQRFAVEHQEFQLQRFSFTLAPVLNLKDLAPAAELHFPGLNIDHCFVALYDREQPETIGPLPASSRLLLAYQSGKAEFSSDGPAFPTRSLFPKYLQPEDRHTMIFMPLSMRDSHFGYIGMQVGPHDWEIYTRLRNLFSSAIFRSLLVEEREQARHEVEHLLAETKQHAAELAAAKEVAEASAHQAQLALKETEGLLSAARAILGATEVASICESLTAQFNELVEADRVLVFLVDHTQKCIQLSIQNGAIDEDLQTTYQELCNGISGIVFKTGQPVLSNSPYDGIEPPETAERRKNAGTGALIVVPLINKGEVLGTVTALNRIGQRQFTHHDVDLLMSLATQAAAAIANAQLYSAEQKRRTWAEALEQVGRNLVSSLDLQKVPSNILEELAILTPFERGSVMMQDGNEMRIIAQLGFPSSELAMELRVPIRPGDVFEQVVAARSPVIIADVSQVPGWSQVDWLPINKSWMGVPLINQDRVIGMISLTRAEVNAFSQEDTSVAQTFAYQAAIALENARLYEQTARFNEQLEHWVEQRTEELNNALQTLEKLHKNKSDFISVAAHELRTPLTVLKGYTFMMQADPTIQANPVLVEALKSISKGTDRLHEIINSMLDVVRIDSETLAISRVPTSIQNIISQIHKDFIKDLEVRQLTLTIEDLSQVPIIYADNNMMYKVFYNLVINAIKYTPDGGHIKIEGRCIHDEHRGEYVEMIVSDTGIGIDHENQQLIFEKFYMTGKVALHSSGKTKFKGGGPGLGLSIARGVVTAHGGKIWVDSPGQNEATCPGSSFHVLLPVSA